MPYEQGPETMHTTVLYHDHCPDGFAAALATWLHLGTAAQYLPVSYGQPPPPIPAGHDVLMVDFSYDAQTLMALARGHTHVTVLDHHLSSQQDLTPLLEHGGQRAGMPANMDIMFDLEESGATLAWKYFQGAKHPDTLEIEMPLFFKYIRDRDLWQWRLPMSKAISLALWAYPREFELWHRLMADMQTNAGMQNLVREGVAIERYAARLVEDQAQRVRWGELDGHAVPYVNASTLFSEVGEALCVQYPQAPFSAYYFDREDGRRQWGLRGKGTVDLSAVAREFGGGGHGNAAGFVSEAGWLPLPAHRPQEGGCQ